MRSSLIIPRSSPVGPGGITYRYFGIYVARSYSLSRNCSDSPGSSFLYYHGLRSIDLSIKKSHEIVAFLFHLKCYWPE